MNEPKRHHIMPESYLARFCRDGILWAFNRTDGSCKPQTPVNTAVRNHFYSYKDHEGKRRTDIEKLLSRFEGMAAPAFDRLAAGETTTNDDREAIAAFIAFAMSRTVGFKQDFDAARAYMAKWIGDVAFSSINATRATLARHERQTGVKIERSAEEVHAFHLGGKYDVEVPCVTGNERCKPQNCKLGAQPPVEDELGRAEAPKLALVPT